MYVRLYIRIDTNTADGISEIESNFTAHRDSLPAMFIVTPLEKAESIWTDPHPTAPILCHVKRVARKAYDVLSAQLDPPTRRAGEGEGQVPPQDIKVSDIWSICRFHCNCNFGAVDLCIWNIIIYCICTALYV